MAVAAGDDSHLRIYRRTGASVTSFLAPFFPFLFVSDAELLNDVRSRHWVKELAGANHFRFLCVFSRWSDMWSAVQAIVSAYNAAAPRPVYAWAELPSLLLKADPVTQYLLQSGVTSFKGMAFPELHRLQIDIETFSADPHRFSHAARVSDRIILIALSDNRGWQTMLDGRTMPEDAMLRRFAELVRTLDPDVLEGHNIYQFDLPYLLGRFALHGIDPAFGRDGALVRAPEAAAGTRFEQLLIDVPGRNVVDTFLLLEAYDTRRGGLESYGLKAAARHFGFAKPDRVYIPGNRISWHWEHEPDLLVRYALDDLEETRRLSELLLPPYFEMAQMLPLSLSGCIRAGAAAKVESLLLREYLRLRLSVARPSPAGSAAAAPGELLYTGLFQGVCHAEFALLYPPLMLGENVGPASDAPGLFLQLLAALALKKDERAAAGRETEHAEDVLLHAFSGYLGSPKALFGDAEAAQRILRSAQKVLQGIIGSVEARQGTPVHADIHSLYFVPPRNIRTQADEVKFIESLNEGLPRGCRLVHRGRYKAMLGYRKNAYALLTHDDRVVLKGTALDLRTQERFLRTFVAQVVEALLRGTPQRVHALVSTLRRDIQERKLTVADFARTEALRSDMDTYLEEVESGKRNRTASYEAAIAANRRWKPGDRVAFYVTGTDPRAREFTQSKLADDWNPNAPDENSAFYLRRLDEQLRKFQVFFSPEDFERIASPEEAFDFPDSPVSVLTKAAVAAEARGGHEEAEETFEPRIWLDVEED